MPHPDLPARPPAIPFVVTVRGARRSRRVASALAGLAALWLAAPIAVCAATGPVTRLEVRIVTGTDPAAPGGVVELRLRETGRPDRRLTLTRGDAWPAGSTRVIPLPLAEPVDPDAVTRFGLAFLGTGGPADAWDVASAEVYAVNGRERTRLLDVSLQGLVRHGGEIATPDRAASTLTCRRDADCDDGRACNGRERCTPGARGGDARGCQAGAPLMCPTNQVCVEGQGCRGVDGGVGAGPATGLDADDAVPPSPAVAPAAPAPTSRPLRGVTALQSCSGTDVLLTEADGTQRRAACSAGTACVPQPNGSGVCAPVVR
ncbi:MAG: hypothetical protein O9284_19140 [Steroidobacteraceae bacterium]|nr:hypothetical protein [Steroidobacteraceae bacterium]